MTRDSGTGGMIPTGATMLSPILVVFLAAEPTFAVILAMGVYGTFVGLCLCLTRALERRYPG